MLGKPAMTFLLEALKDDVELVRRAAHHIKLSLSTRLTIFFGVISSFVIFDTFQSIVERLIPEISETWILILDIFKILFSLF